MPELTAFFLLVALAAYVLFGGADFGGGVLEATLPTSALRKKLQATLGPVWEANHVWLIAVVVILFVGFPRFYTTALTRLYVPISLALMAILVRGTFFTLRKYDPAPGSWKRVYSLLFRISSLGAPLFFGFTLSGLLATHPGTPHEIPTGLGFAAIYVTPWLDAFGLASGLFIASLFGYTAAVFFYGELSDSNQRRVVARRIRQFFAASFVLGGVVLLLGALSGRVEPSAALKPLQLLSHACAALGVVVLFLRLKKNDIWGMRLAVGLQILAILLGWWSSHYPELMRTEGGSLTLHDVAAPFITQLWLVIGLALVMATVIPLLVVLYRVFRQQPGTTEQRAGAGGRAASRHRSDHDAVDVERWGRRWLAESAGVAGAASWRVHRRGVEGIAVLERVETLRCASTPRSRGAFGGRDPLCERHEGATTRRCPGAPRA